MAVRILSGTSKYSGGYEIAARAHAHNELHDENQNYTQGSYRGRGFVGSNAFHPARYYQGHRRFPGAFGPANRNTYLMQQSENVPLKPKVVTIVRNGARPRNNVKILLNRRSVQSFEQLMGDITEAFGPKWKNNKVRKLFTTKGHEVQGISDFFRDDDIFIGVGSDQLTESDIQDIIEELFPDSPYAKNLMKDFEKQKKKKKLAAAHQHEADKRDSGFGEGSDGSNREQEQDYLIHKTRPQEKGRHKNDYPRDMEVGLRLEQEKEKADRDERDRAKRRRMKVMETERRIVEDENRKKNLVPGKQVEDPFRKATKEQKVREREDARRKREEEKQRHQEEDERQKEKERQEREKAEIAARERQAAAAEKAEKERLEREKAEKEKEKEKERIKKEKEKEKEKEIAEKALKTPDVQATEAKANETKVEKAKSEKTEKDKEQAEKDKEKGEKEKEGKAKDSEKEKDGEFQSDKNKNDGTEKVEKKKKKQKQKIVRKTKLERQISSDDYVYNKYELGRTLGDGNFAIVRYSKLKNIGTEYAMKVIDKSKLKGKEHMVENEIEIMKDCNHPNIVKLYEEYETVDKIYLVMELVKGGDLFDAITQSVKFGEVDSAHMVKDLCNALFYLHSRIIVHRDLKPENLLVHRNKDMTITLKLADFGLAMEVKEPIYTVCGTPTYVAPEILSEIGYGLEVDMWAVGVISYILLCGFPPFRSPDRNQTELFEFIKAGEYEFLSPYWDNISLAAKDLIEHLLVVDKKKRYTATDVLCHSWILCGGDMNSIPKEKLPQLHQQAKSELEAQAKLGRESYLKLKEKRAN
ncbi:hypothetical protein CHS0354_043187 [Potamilus streckersoni]|uniref:non-specific serine/threonine protein kinase n=1 Tax=Potamilus streckersoni TaxID=2493646 RepID=A0AAE0SN02_9BIVA|nr:hypothetical protein CHS0354_043187 [Potamilus streckersoni]